MSDFLGILVSILPVAVFLLSLVLLDSFKLVGGRSVLTAVCAGLAVAVVCYFVNTGLMDLTPLPVSQYVRYVGPPLEEIAKAGYVIWLLLRRRVGFLVDAAIYGFAVGAGFAIYENINSLLAMPEPTFPVWIVRGFGTAVMHGGATALFGIIAQGIFERRGAPNAGAFAAGLLLAAAVHSLYNHFLLSPIHSALGMMVGMPLLMYLVFQISERMMQQWLGVGFDSDSELLAMMDSGNIRETRLGAYLLSLKSRLAPEVVVDMLCLLRLHVELSIRAKGVLIARQAGLEIPRDPELADKFAELKHLEKAVGRTGMLALLPFLHRSRRDLWQLTVLEQQ